jgi:integrase
MAIMRRKNTAGRVRYLVRVNRYDAAGKRGWKTIGTFDTLKEAKAQEAAAVDKRERGGLIDAKGLTVATVLDQWLAVKGPDLSANTLNDYRVTIERHIKPALGRKQIDRLQAFHIQDTYTAWAQGDEPLSPHVVRQCHLRLSAALDHAVRMRIISVNPARDVGAPKLPRARFDHWNPGEAKAFLAAVAAFHNQRSKAERSQRPVPAVLWDLLLREGMRRGEALGLRWRDINWQRGTAHVIQTVSLDKSNRGAARIQDRAKTKAGERTVRLAPETIEALKARQAAWRLEKLSSSAWQDTDLIVCTVDGGPINPSNVQRSFGAILKLATHDGKPLRRIKIHELRHTSATLLMLAGVPAKVVSERLGHASIAITLDTYSHVLPDMQGDAAEAMSRILA